jgi:hypothetical protein
VLMPLGQQRNGLKVLIEVLEREGHVCMLGGSLGTGLRGSRLSEQPFQPDRRMQEPSILPVVRRHLETKR